MPIKKVDVMPKSEAVKFVRICYEILLNRSPKANEGDSWVKALMNGSKSELDVIYGFVISNEFQKLQRRMEDGKK